MIIAYLAIALLNILNYCLLDNCFKMEQIKDENLSMRRQIDFSRKNISNWEPPTRKPAASYTI